MKYKILFGESNHYLYIVPDSHPGGRWYTRNCNLEFHEAKAIVIDHLEDEKKRVDELLEQIGNLTEEDCLKENKEYL